MLPSTEPFSVELSMVVNRSISHISATPGGFQSSDQPLTASDESVWLVPPQLASAAIPEDFEQDRRNHEEVRSDDIPCVVVQEDGSMTNAAENFSIPRRLCKLADNAQRFIRELAGKIF